MTKPSINNIQDIIALPRSEACMAAVLTHATPMSKRHAKREFIAQAVADSISQTIPPNTFGFIGRDMMRDLLLGNQLAMLDLAVLIYKPELDKQLSQDDKEKLKNTSRISENSRNLGNRWISWKESNGITRYAVMIRFLTEKIINKQQEAQVGQEISVQQGIIMKKVQQSYNTADATIKKIGPLVEGESIPLYALTSKVISALTSPFTIKDYFAMKIFDAHSECNSFKENDSVKTANTPFVEQLSNDLMSELFYAMITIDLERQISSDTITPDEKTRCQAVLGLLHSIHALKEVLNIVMEVEGAATERLMKPKVEKVVKTAAVAAAGALVAGGVFVATMEIGAAAGVTGVEVGAFTKAMIGAGDAAHVMQTAANAAPILMFCAVLLGITIGIGGVSVIGGHKIYNRPDPAIAAQNLLDQMASGNVDVLQEIKNSLSNFASQSKDPDISIPNQF
ncbi:MAG: hypothetical protein JSS50_00835 [Proteobacteria bacterium]|nr:hypothetical protein [Pseudomonadota bacterium]